MLPRAVTVRRAGTFSIANEHHETRITFAPSHFRTSAPMMKTRIALAVAALLAAGCDTPASMDGYTDPVRLEFSTREIEADPMVTEPEIVFTGGDGEVVVEGRVSTGNPCQDFSADALGVNGRRLELVVQVRQRQGLCAAVIGRFEYTARLLELEPGTYDLSLVHEYSGNGRGQYRRATQVTVR